MLHAVGRYFVAALGDLPYERRMAARDPAEDEERRYGMDLVEQVEEPMRVPLHARRPAIPSGSRRVMRERLDLEIILHVHAHRKRRLGSHET
jgi:hypothetical protein